MAQRKIRSTDSNLVETPQGLFTASGVWFAATRESLEKYAGNVFVHEPLEKLIQRSEVWLRSPETFAVWLLPLAMFVLRPVPATLSVIAVYVAWKILGPSVVSRSFERVLALAEPAWVQGIFYVGILSYFAALDQLAVVWIGLAGFVVIRWRLLSWVVRPLVHPVQKSLYGLPVPDQVLRAFIYRTALAYRESIPEIDRMERHVADVLWKRK